MESNYNKIPHDVLMNMKYSYILYGELIPHFNYRIDRKHDMWGYWLSFNRNIISPYEIITYNVSEMNHKFTKNFIEFISKID